MLKPDSFDDLVDDVIREERRPKVAPPPGMTGTTPARASAPRAPRIRLTPHQSPVVARFFVGLGIGTIGVTLGTALFLVEGFAERMAVFETGLISGMIAVAAGVALDRLDAAAHWSRQTAEAIWQDAESRVA